MLKRSTGLVVALIVGLSTVVAGNHVGPRVKHPPSAIAGEMPVRPPADNPGYPASYSLGPGDSIGYVLYDYGTNGSPNRNVIKYEDGAVSFARMGAVDAATDTRGSYYKHFDGVDWSTAWSSVEVERRGWTNIDQIVDAGGVEVIMSHAGLEFNVGAARGSNVWSSITAGGTPNPLWPRIAVGDGFTVHCIYRDDNPGVITYYMVSNDAGSTWLVDQTLWAQEAGSPDGYDITAQGSKVAAVAGGEGNDIVLVESTDGGGSWTESVIYDIDETLTTPDEEVPDGAVSVLYDHSGNLHIAWGNYLSMGDGGLYYSVDAGIRHWSEATGIQEMAWPDPDTTIGLPGVDGTGRDGNYASEPDLAASASGGLYIVFNRMINETDDSSNYYQHIFMTQSLDGGATWSEAADITPGTGFDASFATVADLADDYLYFAYFCDPWASNNLSGHHDQIEVAIMFHMVNVTGVDVGEDPAQLPAAYRLEQNYPNPFNPTTEIEIGIKQTGPVSLKIFNLLGQEVATLVRETLAPGYYTFSWDASEYTSGVYLYRLQAGNFVETKKLVLLK